MHVAYFVKILTVILTKEIEKKKKKQKVVVNHYLKNCFYLKYCYNMVKSFGITMASKPNFYYIVYDSVC